MEQPLERLLTALAFGLMVACPLAAQSKLAIMNLSCGFVGLIHCFAALPIILRLREAFYRERSSQMYAPWVYSTSLALVELPFLFVSMLCFLVPFYWLVGFAASASLFFRFLLVDYLMALLFAYMGHLLASALPNIQLAAMVQGAIVSLFFLFSGVYIRKGSMPHAYNFAYYIDPGQHTRRNTQACMKRVCDEPPSFHRGSLCFRASFCLR